MSNNKKNVYDEINNYDNYEKNGVRYVNTTHKEFDKRMSDRYQANPTFNLSTRKATEYKCDLSPIPGDSSKEWGPIYLFPHYLIESPKYRIEPDKDTDFVNITHICTYNELITVLIDKKDMSCQGFKAFILDTLDNMLNTVNECEIPKTIDPEEYASYRQLMSLIHFINKYNKYLHILPYRFKNVLVHILGDNERRYRVYAIATIAENGVVRGDITNNHLFEKYTLEKMIADCVHKNYNRKYKKYEEKMNSLTNMSDKIDYKITNRRVFEADLINNYNDNLGKLVQEFNEKADEIGIEETWKTNVGFVILKYIDYIAEFKKDMKPIKLYVDEYKHLCFTDRVKKSEILDNFCMFGTIPTPKQNADYEYNPDDFKVEDDSDYITEPGSMIIIFNDKNLEDDAE